MEIEIRLKAILEQYRLYRHGVTQDIARCCGVHRHTIRKLLHNQLTHPSLEVLGRVCEWLEEQGVPRERLPQALFGARPSKLCQALAERGRATIYLGVYHEVDHRALARRWISPHDALVESRLVQLLSTPSGLGGSRATVHTEYVPFRYSTSGSKLAKSQFQEDVGRARVLFEQMRSAGARGSVIVVGSQRVNYLTELLIAELFGCQPFTPVRSSPRVPFYLTYRNSDRAVPSAFGGLRNPPGRRGRLQPGTYYLNEAGQWEVCEWRESGQDAGLLVTVYDPGNKVAEMVVFGFTGRSTEALGALLVESADRFWPPTLAVQGKKIGVFICRFQFSTVISPSGETTYEVEDVDVVRLSRQVLRQCFR